MSYKYKCDNGHVILREELVNEMDYGYDQDKCPLCGDIMFNNITGAQFCKTVN